MIPVKQTTRGGKDSPPEERGDCFSACLASLLELQIDEVPRFCELASEDWGPEIDKWVQGYGFAYLELVNNDYIQELRAGWGYHIVNALSPRGHRHSVVAFGPDLVFDPHPDIPDHDPRLLPQGDDNEWVVGILIPRIPTTMMFRR